MDPAYEIRVRGHFAERFQPLFAPFEVARVEGEVTVLRGAVADQSALYGVLRRFEQTGVVLLSLVTLDDASEQA